MANKHSNDFHKAWIAVGQGPGMGSVKCTSRSFGRLQSRLEDVMVDKSITWAQYLNLQKRAKDGDKSAFDKVLEHKAMAGNWSPAKFRDNRRRLENLEFKTYIVLDLDNLTPEKFEDLQLGLLDIDRYAYHWHTTRSHTPEKPRVRMVIAVSRNMTIEEANAIGRLVSLLLDPDPEIAIEIPDKVSWRPNQISFWPSISEGQPFLYGRNEATILDVDEFLEEHPRWTDYEWLPYQEDESRRAIDQNAKLADPLEKPGIIGAWCRAFDVEDVISRWLYDIYQPAESSGRDTRYTYVPGTSGSAGAIVVDGGRHLYSHHGNDPIQGIANAWDLLRIHKFGHEDSNARADTPLTSLPSHKAMVAFAQEQPEVAQHEFRLNDDKLDDDDLDDEEDGEEEDGPARPGPARRAPGARRRRPDGRRSAA